ncbi:hypothetical protein K210_04740 [Erysipelothrix rhusiopathiae SY1027]|uniref:hypothetical protein n=1 Tax=Erysipelothrix rhusiopathiae TaxID=1648 RepID=UPI0003348E77|nr:hypothetical protein [Erysipelothrix rhusiopathiae]AGN24551.1 hypothetical protein K210_04740 [Erysipelothrix rhusiopathiae SY1027]
MERQKYKKLKEQSNKLRRKGIKQLESYFMNSEQQKLIQRKFTNISGKTGRYFVPETLFQKRTPRKNRALIPFEHVVNANLTYEHLDSFEGGVAVEFVNNQYFDQLGLPEQQQNPVFKKLKNKLGSDDNVSAVINIRSTGSSSSQSQRIAIEKLNELVEKNNMKIKDLLIRRKQDVKYSGQGNDKWEGFIYYSIKGGQQDATDSHVEYKIPSKDVQLFNPSVEYAGELVSNDITLVLIYFALYSVPEEKRDESWEKLVLEYLEYFSKRKYNKKSLKEYVSNHISLNLIEGQLVDPIQVEPINIEDFAISSRKEDSLDITHQTSVNRYSYIWDEEQEILLTAARPTNLFWSKHLSNMMQQDFSLKEYFIHQREIMEKWDDFGIDKLED